MLHFINKVNEMQGWKIDYGFHWGPVDKVFEKQEDSDG